MIDVRARCQRTRLILSVDGSLINLLLLRSLSPRNFGICRLTRACAPRPSPSTHTHTHTSGRTRPAAKTSRRRRTAVCGSGQPARGDAAPERCSPSPLAPSMRGQKRFLNSQKELSVVASGQLAAVHKVCAPGRKVAAAASSSRRRRPCSASRTLSLASARRRRRRRREDNGAPPLARGPSPVAGASCAGSPRLQILAKGLFGKHHPVAEIIPKQQQQTMMMAPPDCGTNKTRLQAARRRSW